MSYSAALIDNTYDAVEQRKYIGGIEWVTHIITKHSSATYNNMGLHAEWRCELKKYINEMLIHHIHTIHMEV